MDDAEFQRWVNNRALKLSCTPQNQWATRQVLEERVRQDMKWGNQRAHTDFKWLAILMEEVGEVAKAILEHDLDNVEEEIIQVAAVAVCWLESKKGAKDGWRQPAEPPVERSLLTRNK